MTYIQKLLRDADQRRASELEASLNWLFKHGNPAEGISVPVHSTLDGTFIVYVAARFTGAVDVDGSLDGGGSYRFRFESGTGELVLHLEKED